MAGLFCDSFDHWATADGTLKWTHQVGNTGGGSAVISTGRNSTSGLYLQGNNAGQAYLRKVLPSTYATLIVGVAYQYDNTVVQTSRVPLIGLDDQTAPGEQISVALDIDQMKLVVVVNNAVVATGTTVLSANVFYYIELKATINNTTGSYTVRLNEVSEITASGVNTRGTGSNNYANAVRLGGDMGFSIFGSGSGKVIGRFDDFWACDDSGGVNNDFLGDCRVEKLAPNGPGAHSAWTASTGVNWQNVDDGTPDGDTTYNQDGSAGDIDTYTMEDLIPTTGTIKFVQTVIDARKDDAGSHTVAPVFRIGGTDYAGTAVAVNTTYSMGIQEYQVSPATSAAWTISEVNALEMGPKLVS